MHYLYYHQSINLMTVDEFQDSLIRLNGLQVRQFLLYTGKIILIDLCSSKEHYDNFVRLSIACCLMVDKRHTTVYHDTTQKIMNKVVKGFKKYYGPGFLTYNPHS